MRVPTFYFMLHSLAAMVLVINVSAAFSVSTQTFQSNKREPTGRQLRTQDSQAQKQKQTIDDEERIPCCRLQSPLSDTFSRTGLSTVITQQTAKKSRIFRNSGHQQTQPWSKNQYSKFLDNMQSTIDETQLDTMRNLWSTFLKNKAILEQKKPVDIPFPDKTDSLNPYIRLALYTALKLQPKEGKIVKNSVDMQFHLNELVRYGFTRDEVEVIFRTAGYGDFNVLPVLRSYDDLWFDLVSKDNVKLLSLYPDSTFLPEQLKSFKDIRAANFIANDRKPKRFEFDTSPVDTTFILLSWMPLLKQWIRTSYSRQRVQKILEDAEIEKNEVQRILGLYGELVRKMQTWLLGSLDEGKVVNKFAVENDKRVANLASSTPGDPHSTEKLTKLFSKWISHGFSRKKVLRNLRFVIQDEKQVSSVMKIYDNLVLKAHGQHMTHQ
ncbi:hypothetical protein Plhal304r1_c036g0111101 [Plasmopara halstedii]